MFSRIFSRVEWLFGDVFCGLIIAFIAAFICTEILGRLTVNHSFMGIVDIVSLCLIILVFAPLAAVQRDGAHIRMDLIVDRLSGKRSGLILEIVNLVIGICITGFLCFAAVLIFLHVYHMGSRTVTIFLPWYPAAIFMPIGFLLFAIRMGMQVKSNISKMRARTGHSEAT